MKKLANIISKITSKESDDYKKQIAIELIKSDEKLHSAYIKFYEENMDVYKSDNLFEQKPNKKVAKEINDDKLNKMIDTIVAGLMQSTYKWTTMTVNNDILNTLVIDPIDVSMVCDAKEDDIISLPKDKRPCFTALKMQRDVKAESFESLLFYYQKYLQTNDPSLYAQFRIGLDILDLDPMLYELLSRDPNAMLSWLPKIYDATYSTALKVPKTTIIKVPMSLLQSTRIKEYEELNDVEKTIINKYAKAIFKIEDGKDYFIKTGSFSSKFEFQNAHVMAEETKDIGEYLWFITHQASQMASPLNSRQIYGVSSNNQWVVREYIENKENLDTIYNGLPLRCEFRVFVDFDKKEILGISNYWRADVMEKSLGQTKDPKQLHDYLVYCQNKERLEKTYENNKDFVLEQVQLLLDQNIDLKGQYSIDIMKESDDFYLIDMALAKNSALNDVVPADKLSKTEYNLIETK